jgi:hypothetical protein
MVNVSMYLYSYVPPSPGSGSTSTNSGASGGKLFFFSGGDTEGRGVNGPHSSSEVSALQSFILSKTKGEDEKV